MAIYISLLRGINVGGQNKISMEDLRKIYESLGLKSVKTYIQSGNVIFQYSNTSTTKLANKIESKIKQYFKLDVAVLILTKNEFHMVIENNPFHNEDQNKIHTTFISSCPTDIPIDDMNKIKDRSELFSIIDKQIYLFCPNGYGKSKLSNMFFERKLKVIATTRNWKTVSALYDIANSLHV
jgi:uncharacterized protein (DUF1697 family)